MITDLDDARFIHPSHADVLENLRIDFALARVLDNSFVFSGKQRPESVGLRLPLPIGTEREVDLRIIS
jgi:hypothetical protein